MTYAESLVQRLAEEGASTATVSGVDAIKALVLEAMAHERERCAEVADDEERGHARVGGREGATACNCVSRLIRALPPEEVT